MAIALERITDACREHRVCEKIVVAPSLAIGHQIADAIAHAGTAWVNLRIETVGGRPGSGPLPAVKRRPGQQQEDSQNQSFRLQAGSGIAQPSEDPTLLC